MKQSRAFFLLLMPKQQKVWNQVKRLSTAFLNSLKNELPKTNSLPGVPTGYYNFDEITAGLQPSDLIIVAGRPSMGKTAFALNVAMRAAGLYDVPVAIFSLEMSMEQLMQRMLCSWGKVDLSKLRRGRLGDEEWGRLYEAANSLAPSKIFIDDTPAINTMEMRARCRRLKAEHGLGLILVDYLQLIACFATY